ncbi:MAG: hypothetical protein ACRCZP_01970, partial [Phycicoccus sp.]
DSGTFWRPEHFVVDQQAQVADYVLSVDAAMRSAERHDETAMTLGGIGRDGRAVIEWTWSGRVSATRLREMIAGNVRRNPKLRTVIVETNQGADDVWAQLLTPAPPGVRILGYSATAPKRDRMEDALDAFERDRVRLARERTDQAMAPLVTQACMYPAVKHDDLLDSMTALLRYLFMEPGRRAKLYRQLWPTPVGGVR